jgi:tetratricopeptide (TPR) repeat protein
MAENFIWQQKRRILFFRSGLSPLLVWFFTQYISKKEVLKRMNIIKFTFSGSFFDKLLKFSLLIAVVAFTTSCGAEKKKNDRDRFFLLGNEALKGNENKEAIRLYTEALALDNDYADAFNNRGIAHMKRGDAASALLDFNQAILIDAENLSYVWNRAEAYAGANRYDKAVSDITVVRKAFPDSARVYFSEGVIHFQFKEYQQAEAAFTESLMRDNSNGEAYINRGTVRYYLNKLDSAQSDLEQGLLSHSEEGNAWNTLAMVASAKGNNAKGLDLINKAIDISPNEAYFLNNRGYVYLQLDSLEKAVKDIDASLLRDPQNAWAYRNKGIYYYKAGNFEEALRLLTRAESMDIQMTEVQLWLGKAYLAIGEKEKACKALGAAEQTAEALNLITDNC